MLFTIGHSNRSLNDFLALLRAHKIELLADIRTVPKSRHNPQFNREALAESLPSAGIDYLHLPHLGGLRHPRPDSINLAWRNASFRGYADYMQTPAFETALEELLQAAAFRRTAIMCAEAVPWRCHRSLVADALLARGVPVEHILSASAANPHKLTPFAAVEGGKVTYPGLFPAG
ncbi:MAG TPA: DUF488 domain-containing protein [Bryobacteraceae bacterium]|nr:DUF488 domain-containing protein [Bryobacteraceae bacterium]